MPSGRPSAAFDPIPPDLDLARLVEETPNFEYVTRISCDMIEQQGFESFDKLVLLHVILAGKPLVIEGFNYRLDEWTFTSQWLQDNCGKKFEQARVLNKRQNMPISIGHYLTNMSKLTDQWTPANYKDPDRQRVYMKDIDCPQIWHDKLKEQIPQSVFYLNDCTGDVGGPGSVEGLPGSPNTKGQGIARAGDLMSCLPPPMRAENMMCYIGHEGTYTPAHREMCASLGHNLMVETSGFSDENGKPTKPGSSIWFMTETNDRHMVSEYWLSALGHDIEVENHFAQINAWKAAPFKTYVVDQRAGDFILIPPLAPHQVWNRGTRTMKVAWNRTTVETLEMALHEALPRARMVCRDEQYKNKAIVYYALEKYSGLLKDVETQKQSASPGVQYELDYGLKIRQLQKDFRRLFSLYTEILLSEMLAPVTRAEKPGQYLPYDSFVTCSYCRCNIFNRFLTCTSCIEVLENGDQDTYDICMDCFTMGRSCRCISKYRWVEQFHWKDLIRKHELWRQEIIRIDGGVNEKSPQSLDNERKKLGRKTLAEICQEQLRVRPYQDPTKSAPKLTGRDRRKSGKGLMEDDEDEEIAVDDNGNVRKSKSKKTRAQRLPKSWTIEHVSHDPEQKWKVASCSKCNRSYGYGSLYRMFDLTPQSVMQHYQWECPACLKICSCAGCRKRAGFTPYEPVGTVLGHDTKKVADPRSVESLVNFSLPNTNWIKVTGDDHPHENRRLSRRKDEAEKAKAQDLSLDDNYVDEEQHAPVGTQYMHNGIMYTIEPDIPIDPMLSMDQCPGPVNGTAGDRDADSEYTESPQRTQDESPDSGYGDRISERDLTPPSHGVRSKREHRGSQGPRRPPIANMVPQVIQSPIGNGNTYEHPHVTSLISNSEGQNHNPKHPLQGELIAGIVRSNLKESLPSAGNGQSQRAPLARMRDNAEDNDRYSNAGISFPGKSLRVKLSISSAKLALVARTDRGPHKVVNGMQSIGKEPPLLLQSDYQSTPQAQQSNISKKRKSRAKDDGDFRTHKRRNHEALARNASLQPKDTRRNSVRYTEISSDSESSAQVETNPFKPVNKPKTPRPLPNYLAQCHGHEESSDQRPAKDLSTPTSKPQGNDTSTDQLVHSEKPQPVTDPSPVDARIAEPLTQIDPDISGSKVESKATSLPVDPALQLAKDNRKAKLKALHWADNDDDDSSGSSSSDEKAPVNSSKPNTMAVPKSILSRPGAKGKKVKIVAAKDASISRKAASKAVEIARRSLGM